MKIFCSKFSFIQFLKSLLSHSLDFSSIRCLLKKSQFLGQYWAAMSDNSGTLVVIVHYDPFRYIYGNCFLEIFFFFISIFLVSEPHGRLQCCSVHSVKTNSRKVLRRGCGHYWPDYLLPCQVTMQTWASPAATVGCLIKSSVKISSLHWIIFSLKLLVFVLWCLNIIAS